MTPATSPAWGLVQIAELVRRAEQTHLAVMRLLPGEARADLPEHASASMTGAAIQELQDLVAEGAEIVEQVGDLARSLPAEDVAITYEEVRSAAAADLAEGILDAERVLVAARVLDTEIGWPALAEGMRAVDIRESWTGSTPCATLCAFRGADRPVVKRALRLAEIPWEAGYHDCTADQLARLADVIDELGRASRR